MHTYRTAESVSPRHPDKTCDRISDAILDLALERDPYSRVAIETMGGHGQVYITGELTCAEAIRPSEITEVVHRIAGPEMYVTSNIVQQSGFIANGVDAGGAGDQGIMVGYACRDNKALIPHEAYLARALNKYLYEIQPEDGKTQITLKDGKIETVVASWANTARAELQDRVAKWLDIHKDEIVVRGAIHANPAGDWSQSGFEADAGLTGRKLMVDNYGPRVPIGGGAFSGKDATKVDRSAAYAARQAAVQLLQRHDMPNVHAVRVELAYAIGLAAPVQATATILDKKEAVLTRIELNPSEYTPAEIISRLELRLPQFEPTAEWGHFGNGFTWDE